MAIAVTALAVTPVKGTRIQRVERIELERSGARGNRRFFVIDRRGRMVNAKLLGELQTVVAECSDDRLCLRFPDGRVVQGEVVEREPVTARFFSRSVDGLVLDGPWTDALSSHVGQ